MKLLNEVYIMNPGPMNPGPWKNHSIIVADCAYRIVIP